MHRARYRGWRLAWNFNAFSWLATLPKLLYIHQPKLIKSNHSRVFIDLTFQTQDSDDTTLTAESEEELKSLLMRVKEESEKLGW